MASRQLSRRNFLSSSALVSVAMVLSAANAPMTGPLSFFDATDDRSNENKEKTLSQIARHFFPHKSVSDGVYSDAISNLVEGGEGQNSFLDALDTARNKPWNSLSKNDQITVLKEYESEPYFGTALAHIRGQIYENPAVWKIIGYGGPSAHLGGYLHRGFDDIDWLPESQS